MFRQLSLPFHCMPRIDHRLGCTWPQACKDKRSALQESLDTVKLSYSQITAQTTEMTQQVFHMTSRVRSQVSAVLPHAKDSSAFDAVSSARCIWN